MSNPTEEERRVAIATIRWIKVAREHYGPDWLPTEPDVWHSALLRRLLAGKEPTPERPPVQHSYPVYPD